LAKRKKGPRRGVCALTGEFGDFVRSHIIPEALTRPEVPGQQFVQGGIGVRPIWRRTSWYDPKLVIRTGEDVLSSIDNAGIAELRRHKLIWSSWGPAQRAPGVQPTGMNGHGFRTITGINARNLRLFFLSLLWRAAAATIPEFSEIRLSDPEMDILRLALVTGQPPPYHVFPVNLVQISTLGVPHNNTAVYEKKIYPSFEDAPEEEIDIFRFYFDGLIVHIHHTQDMRRRLANAPNLCIDGADRLDLATVEYEHSAQKDRLDAIMGEAIRFGWLK